MLKQPSKAKPSSPVASVSQPLPQVLTHPDCIGDGRERGVDRADAWEEAGVYHIEIVEFVGLAVHIEHGAGRVAAEATGARLMAHRREAHWVLT